MSTDWARLVETTTDNYLREREVNIMRNRKLLALIESKGRVKLNTSGIKLNWKVQYKRAPLQGFADGDSVTFSRRDRHKTATLDYRAYVMTDAMTEMEKLQNRGTPAIINNYSEIVENMVNDINESFGDEFYKDGNSATNTRGIHGVESFLGAGSNASNGFTTPSDSYAGLSTVPGNYGGNVTGTWPESTQDPHYDFWSPILVNYTDSTSGVYTSSTKTWPNTCLEALRKGITKTQKSKGMSGIMDMILVENLMFEQLKNAFDTKTQLQIMRGDNVGLAALGFKDVLVIDGVEITTEYGLPASTGYGFNTNYMTLWSLQDRLFAPKGPFFDEDSQAWKFQINFYGNLTCNPRYFAKWKNYT